MILICNCDSTDYRTLVIIQSNSSDETNNYIDGRSSDEDFPKPGFVQQHLHQDKL